jgi:hypothetical protein
MSTALRKFEFAHIKEYTVVAGGSATLGYLAILTAATTVDDGATGSDLGIGVFLGAAAAGERVEVALMGPVVPVTVGTGGATLGLKAIFLNDGFTDAPAHDSSGATNNAIYGVFMETGVAGDRVGMMMALGNRGSA